MANQRIRVGSPATLKVTLTDQNGEPRATTGAVTVHVTRANGTDVLAPGSAAAAGSDTGAFSVSLNASQTELLDWLTCAWSEAGGGTYLTTVEVVGGFYFTLNEARDADRALRDVGRFPDADILRVRQEVEEECERITGRAFVPRYARRVLDGNGTDSIYVRETDLRKLRSLMISGATFQTDYYIAYPSGRIVVGSRNALNWEVDEWDLLAPRFWAGRANVVVDYEYGWDSPPADLQRAAIARLRDRLLEDKTSIPSRATSLNTPDGTFSLYTPGVRGASTNNPDVDAVYARYERQDNPDASDFVGSARVG